MRLLNKDFFYPNREKFPNAISIDRLILLGLLLCDGTAQARAEVLWGIVQDEEAKFIAWSDKDFFPICQDLLEISVIMLKNYTRR